MLKHALKYIFFGLMFMSHAQEHNSFSYIDLNVYTGSLARHNESITHQLEHPNGLILGWNKRVSGTKAWHRRYDLPEFGVS